jgi:hypothetical protein
VKKLAKLSWRARGYAGTCFAEVDQPIRGYRVTAKYLPSRPVDSGHAGAATPLVSWISFDGDVYWVRLATAIGWPRTIRVTQSDVEGVRK